MGLLENEGKLEDIAAIFHSPLLILHGEDDRRVPPFQAELSMRSYAARATHVRLLRVPGRGHDDLHAAPEYTAAVGLRRGRAVGKHLHDLHGR